MEKNNSNFAPYITAIPLIDTDDIVGGLESNNMDTMSFHDIRSMLLDRAKDNTIALQSLKPDMGSGNGRASISYEEQLFNPLIYNNKVDNVYYFHLFIPGAVFFECYTDKLMAYISALPPDAEIKLYIYNDFYIGMYVLTWMFPIINILKTLDERFTLTCYVDNIQDVITTYTALSCKNVVIGKFGGMTWEYYDTSRAGDMSHIYESYINKYYEKCVLAKLLSAEEADMLRNKPNRSLMLFSDELRARTISD